MNLGYVDLAKNIKNVAELYKKNIKQLNINITAKEIPKLIFDLKKFSINTLTLFFFMLSALKSSN